jgi:hypothetical protein
LNGVNVVLPWIVSALIILIVAVACRFIEEGPRSDDPPDSDGNASRVLISAAVTPQ